MLCQIFLGGEYPPGHVDHIAQDVHGIERNPQGRQRSKGGRKSEKADVFQQKQRKKGENHQRCCEHSPLFGAFRTPVHPKSSQPGNQDSVQQKGQRACAAGTGVKDQAGNQKNRPLEAFGQDIIDQHSGQQKT